MEDDKRVETLESEFKLIKGEVKQTLSSVRDHLLNLKLPASPEAAMLAAAMDSHGGGQSIEGRFSIEKGDRNEPMSGETPPGGKNAGDKSPEDEAQEDESQEPEAELPEGDEAMGDEEQIEMAEGGPMTESSREFNQSVPPVNLLANLIRWVACAKREIGAEQLTTFLEVYGISGHLSPELKEVILHLADITSAGPAETSPAEIWSQLVLELHGILTGADAPLHALRPSWNNGNGEMKLEGNGEEPRKRKPSKLKLVLSGDGGDKEFSFDLKSDDE